MPKPRQHRHNRQEIFKEYNDYTWIGTIVNCHGIQGEVKINPLTDTPEYYLKTTCFFIEQADNLFPFQVEKMRLYKNQWFVKFATIDERDAAETFRKSRVMLEDTELRPLEEGEFFLHQIIGSQVQDLEGKLLGEVIEVLQTGANDVYSVAGAQHTFLVPAVPDIVKEINIEQKTIHIDPIPGLIE
ncbi:MAG: 16S rRNA processing protein RimM [SAR324 cluster bacterium]|nr:16S rRNA processing protein RimM [SAR324 cluster bacterium]